MRKNSSYEIPSCSVSEGKRKIKGGGNFGNVNYAILARLLIVIDTSARSNRDLDPERSHFVGYPASSMGLHRQLRFYYYIRLNKLMLLNGTLRNVISVKYLANVTVDHC